MRHQAVALAVWTIMTFWFVPSCYTPPTVSGDSSSSGSTGTTSSGGSFVDVDCPEECSCDNINGCEFDCGETGCAVATCVGTECTATCRHSNCNFVCTSGSECDFNCINDSCATSCKSASDCKVTCPSGGCVMDCGEASDCLLDCTNAPIPCTINCSDIAGGTCLGNCMTNGC
jgi:hypothetical protein